MKADLILSWPKELKHVNRFNINTTELWMLKEMLEAGHGEFDVWTEIIRKGEWNYCGCTVVIDDTRWQLEFYTPSFMRANPMDAGVFDLNGNKVDSFFDLKNRVYAVQKYKKKVVC